MSVIASDGPSPPNQQLAHMLEGYDCPAILVSRDYQILATNQRYRQQFGDAKAEGQHCYRVSHGYAIPCDQAGEDCPLGAAVLSGHKERVLHVHQTPRGPEHVDVELIPIADDQGLPQFFVELMRPVPLAGARADSGKSLVGETPAFNQMLAKVARVSGSDAAVLLLGESGSGKELVASAIHQASLRKDKALVTLECAGLTDTLFESELFGHVRGAFTGASSQRTGLVELADGGTLFLDEIGDVPLSMQVKLLRLIETGTYRAVGSSQLRHSDFRLVCATHKNLKCMVEAGEFRRDLYYRINVFPLRLPALRERLADLPLLAKSLLQRISPGKDIYITRSAVAVLSGYAFPGNIRELRNILNRAVILSDTNVLEGQDIQQALEIDWPETTVSSEALPSEHLKQAPSRGPFEAWEDPPDLKTAERLYLQQLMAQYQGNKEQVAKVASISLRSLYRKLNN